MTADMRPGPDTPDWACTLIDTLNTMDDDHWQVTVLRGIDGEVTIHVLCHDPHAAAQVAAALGADHNAGDDRLMGVRKWMRLGDRVGVIVTTPIARVVAA